MVPLDYYIVMLLNVYYEQDDKLQNNLKCIEAINGEYYMLGRGGQLKKVVPGFKVFLLIQWYTE